MPPFSGCHLYMRQFDSKNLSEWEGMVVLNTNFVHSGNFSFELFGKYPTELITKQYIPVDMDKTYTLSVWMRTLDAELPASGCLGLRMYDKDKTPIKIVNVGAFTGTESVLTKDAAKDAAKGAKELYIKKTRNVWK